MKKYLTEFVGTFMLVLTVCLAVSSGSPLAPLAIGSVLMVMVYMGGSVSGAHYNPAVSLAMALGKQMEWAECVKYWLVQLLAGLVATLVAAVVNQSIVPAPAADASILSALLAEVCYTFALVIVIFNVAVSKRTAGNSYFGLAIGFTVFVGAVAVGGVSGGAFNPAVGLGTTIIAAITQGASIGHAWLYVVGPFVGAAIAAGVFKLQECD